MSTLNSVKKLTSPVMKGVIVVSGNKTLIDDREFPLDLDQAVELLHRGIDLEGLPFPCFDGDLNDEYPAEELVEAYRYKGMREMEIFSRLRGNYQSFRIA